MRNFFKISLITGITTLLFTACLKDTPTTDYSDTSIKPIVLIPNGNFPSTQEAAIVTFEVSTTPEEIRLYARVSWSKPLGKAIDVTFVKNPALIADFNTKFGTTYAELNADAYSVPTFKVTIPADQNEAYIPISIFTDKVSLTQANMLAFSISDASGEPVSTNFQNIVFPIGVKNKWDGVYSLTSEARGWGAYGIQDMDPPYNNPAFNYPAPGIGMVTAGANSVSTIAYNFGWNFLPAFTASGSSTGFGATTPKFVFDAATNKITSISNTTPPDSRNRELLIDPAAGPADNLYDPATKKIYARFIMKQTGRPDMYRYDVFTYTGPRP